ncbi:SUMF1/EgtB/PvdO family nonheme iron enzyme [Gimesia benthica]|uniref:SUMF1/EgtB/PvdO family nonheme iron enzyme n=1 Tax=Gimesia benthica TaxID=2608982 RepID=A0A6I6AG99_9PLAN|nr:SUMF1/EgtB/PvdO family nonheme iron enzyme [Gimesia benthica]QGQ25623.1 SUMF1/EgtB/PvdO family nonheme iron enzyme [Gimesia benthica]
MYRGQSCVTNRYSRRGITRREVIVVSCVAILLIAIISPLVIYSRESSRLLHCQSNLKRLGTGLAAYHTTYQCLPPAAIWSTQSMHSLSLNMSTRPDLFTHANWALMLLPFVGEEHLAEKMDFRQPVSVEQNSAVRTTFLSVMTCPGDSFNQAENLHIFEPAPGQAISFARGNYAINGGSHNMRLVPGSTTIPSGDGAQLKIDRENREFQYWGNGVAGFNISFRQKDFANGSSSLVVFDEVRAGIHPVDPRGVWAFGQIGGSVTWAHGVNGDDYGPNNQWPRSDDILGCARLHNTVGTETLTKEGMPCVSYLDSNTNATARSLHTEGANVLFLDGASRFLSNQIDPGLWHAIHSRETPSELLNSNDFDHQLATENFEEKTASCDETKTTKQRVIEKPTTLTNSIEMQFVLVPAGTFTMGIPDSGNDFDPPPETPAHPVTLTDDFLLGQYEVTQEQYLRIMGSNPSYHLPENSSGDNIANFPVEQVTWYEAHDFCRQLSNLPAEQIKGRSYRLPTEAEWEYACKAGSDEPFNWSRYQNRSGGTGYAGGIRPALPVTPVGHYTANSMGIYDMRGNVWEWCSDWFDRDYYRRSPRENPRGPAQGFIKVVRGSDWRFTGETCRIDYSMMPPWKASPFVGFRIVCELHQIPDENSIHNHGDVAD